MNPGQPNQQALAAASKSKTIWFHHCVVFAGDGSNPCAPVIAGGNRFGAQGPPIRAAAICSRYPDTNPYVGFCLRFPLPPGQSANEETGFGVRYAFDRKIVKGNGLVQSEEYMLNIKFPRGQADVTVEQAPSAMVKRFPGLERLSFASVRLQGGARIQCSGFGMPYKNPEDPEIEGWINRNNPIVENLTLLDFLAQRAFYIAVPVSPAAIDTNWDSARLPPPFTYPYGTEHRWPPEHNGVTDLTRYADLFERTKSAEIFRPTCTYDDDNSHVAVVTQSVVQDTARLRQASRTNWTGVDSACLYLPNAQPTRTLPYKLGPAGIPEQEDRMELHRAVLRGHGFYDWMTRPALNDDLANTLASISAKETPTARPLPVFDCLGLKNEVYVNALLGEVLPSARKSFRNYLKNRTLGIGTISGAPASGKTTMISVAGLAMEATFGKILASGPTDDAVDTLAYRLDHMTRSVCARYNQGKAQGDPSRARHRLVVRGYDLWKEVDTIVKILKNLDSVPWDHSGWIQELSPAYWLLILLGYWAAEFDALHPDDSEALHHLQEKVNGRPDLANLRAIAAGNMEFQDLSVGEATRLVKFVLPGLMGAIIDAADFLAVTPKQLATGPYETWMKRVSQGVLIDEAGGMHRADLGVTWGNILLPIFLAGDLHQLVPVALMGETTSQGNLYNRLGKDGAISPLAFLAASGLPVYRL